MSDEIEKATDLLRRVAFYKGFPGAITSVDHQAVCIEAIRQLEAFEIFQESLDISNETN